MKKYLIGVLAILCACSSSKYSSKEKEQLDSYGLSVSDLENCTYADSLKVMLENEFDAKYVFDYCEIKEIQPKIVNQMLEKGISASDIQEYQENPSFNIDKLDRYLAQSQLSIPERIKQVNLDMDLKPYENTTIISDTETVEVLVNKFNALPVGYEPADLVDVESVCELGVDYSCTTMAKVQLRKEAASAYEELVQAAKSQGIDIVAIACYRDYAYQAGLYNYNKDLYGIEHADMYYARPGQSEHNTGLAVDITFNGHRFDEIEKHEGYTWIFENMHNYGFVLRYPEDKQEITRFGYESWHLRYVGVDAASEMYEHNQTLEEYHANK